jgi:hypothetical protein
MGQLPNEVGLVNIDIIILDDFRERLYSYGVFSFHDELLLNDRTKIA